jgi:hypothetical protein
MTELQWQKASQDLPQTTAIIQIQFFMSGVPFTPELQTKPCIDINVHCKCKKSGNVVTAKTPRYMIKYNP